MDLTALDPSLLAALADHVGRLKHDLGKYVALQTRWLPPDAPAHELREALSSDLLATRRGPDGSQDAPSVWAEFRPALVGEAELAGGLTVDVGPVIAALDDAMSTVSTVSVALRDGTASADDIQAGTAAASVVSNECRQLDRAVRAALREIDG